jgi:hypothetical protein
MKIPAPILSVLCFLIFVSNGFAQQAPPAQKSANPNKSKAVTPEPQQPAPAMPILPDIRHDPDVESADIAIIANITAAELRFDVVGDPSVEFPGQPKSQTIWHTDRYNLPDKIEPGVTYRNIGIRLKITSRLADIERIVAEALGEIPTAQDNTYPNNDEVKPTPSKTAPTRPAQKPAVPDSSPTTKKVPGE